jgi:hypothetical protein
MGAFAERIRSRDARFVRTDLLLPRQITPVTKPNAACLGYIAPSSADGRKRSRARPLRSRHMRCARHLRRTGLVRKATIGAAGTMEKTMPAMSIHELMQLTQVELVNLAQWLMIEIPVMNQHSPDYAQRGDDLTQRPLRTGAERFFSVTTTKAR